MTIEDIVHDLKHGSLDPSQAVLQLRTLMQSPAADEWRDIFAGMALQGMLAAAPDTGTATLQDAGMLGKHAYLFADAMLVAGAK